MNIMIIGAHPDDVEIGMGGTLIAILQEGYQVTVIDLTDGEPTPYGNTEIRKKETSEANHILGVKNRINLGLKNRYLEDDISSRILLAEQIRINRSEIIFAPYWDDAHPDHIAASRLCDAARFYGKLTKTDMKGEPFYVPRIYYYYVSHLRINIIPSFILDITQGMEQKLAALQCYQSQFGPTIKEPSGTPWVIRTNAYWGGLIRKDYGEAFVSKECIGLKKIGDLL